MSVIGIIGQIHGLLTGPERRRALAVLGLMTVGAALETLGIGLVIPALAVLMTDDPGASYPVLLPLLSALGNPSQAQVVAGGMLALVAVYLVKGLFLTFVIWRQNRFAFSLQARLSQQIFGVYLRQPYTFHLQHNSARLIRNAVNDVTEFTFGGMLPGILLLTEGLVLVGIASLLIIMQPVGALAVGLVLGGAAWWFQRTTRTRIVQCGEARQHHEGLRIQHLQQGLGGAKEVKLLGREAEFLARHHVHNTQSARASQLHYTLLEIPRLGIELLGIMALTALVLTMVVQGRDMDSVVPTLGLFAAGAFRVMPSVNRIVNAIQRLRYALPVIETLNEELKLPVPDPGASTAHVSIFQTSISLDNISYTYPGARTPALAGLSLIIQKNESIGFVGPSGSGKSTLVDIILGLLTPSVGQIRVDGQDIHDDLRAWQNQIGYVPQSIYLTDDTLRRNVAFGVADDQIDEAAVRRAIQAAQLEEFVTAQPEGWDTRVGERGVRLSGGQRQRIGIARALYHDPAVLVLDEATSALDTATERGVIEAVMALQHTKTILVVAHRLSTVEHCDRLYRLEEGRVTAEGASAAMLGGKYV